MPRYLGSPPATQDAQRLATIRNGRIIMIGEDFPPHDLKPNQFEITEKEFKLLYAITDLEEIEKLVNSIREKMNSLEK